MTYIHLSLSHSLTLSLTHSLTRSLIHWPVHNIPRLENVQFWNTHFNLKKKLNFSFQCCLGELKTFSWIEKFTIIWKRFWLRFNSSIIKHKRSTLSNNQSLKVEKELFTFHFTRLLASWKVPSKRLAIEKRLYLRTKFHCKFPCSVEKVVLELKTSFFVDEFSFYFQKLS